ncbi:MAG: Calx-beta domain-containing protein, partial [Acidimicrobiales bacterium]
MKCRRWLLPLLIVPPLFLAAPPAHAACHAFTVAVSPGTLDEGGTVRITVSRDAAVNPSSIDVSTVDGSAHAGSDYTAVDETVSFSSETTKTLTLHTTDDASSEPAETFRVHLSNPGGCAVNPNFSIGPDAQVTIKASDAPTTTVPASTTATGPTRTTMSEELPGQTTTTGS